MPDPAISSEMPETVEQQLDALEALYEDLDLGNVTPAREQALRKLARWSELRSGMGMWDDDTAVVSPAAADWLVRVGAAERTDDPHAICRRPR